MRIFEAYCFHFLTALLCRGFLVIVYSHLELAMALLLLPFFANGVSASPQMFPEHSRRCWLSVRLVAEAPPHGSGENY